jgi:hypothetical protein
VIPSSKIIRPMICASNCEPVSEIGRTVDAATASWAEPAPGPVPVPVPLPAAEVGGAADGVISGNRLAALPAGTFLVTACPPAPTTGSAPMGRATPRPTAATGASENVTPGTAAPAAVAAEPLPVELLPAEPLPAEPLPAEPDEERGDEPARAVALAVGLGDAAGWATVTVGELPVAVSGEPRQLGTETRAENVIRSPAGAVFGTLSWASICAVAGCWAGRDRSQFPLAGLPRQLPAVNTGELNAGPSAPSVSVVAMLPSAAAVDQAVIRNEIVPPGGTLAAEAETITRGWPAAGVGVEVGLPVGVGAGLVVEGDGDAWDQGAREWPVTLGAGLDVAGEVDVLGGVDVSGGVGDAGRVEAADGVDVTDGADEVLGAAEGDDAAEAGGAAVSTMPVTPAEMTKRPVARPSVIGRRYGDRMGHLVCGS